MCIARLAGQPSVRLFEGAPPGGPTTPPEARGLQYVSLAADALWMDNRTALVAVGCGRPGVPNGICVQQLRDGAAVGPVRVVAAVDSFDDIAGLRLVRAGTGAVVWSERAADALRAQRIDNAGVSIGERRELFRGTVAGSAFDVVTAGETTAIAFMSRGGIALAAIDGDLAESEITLVPDSIGARDVRIAPAGGAPALALQMRGSIVVAVKRNGAWQRTDFGAGTLPRIAAFGDAARAAWLDLEGHVWSGRADENSLPRTVAHAPALRFLSLHCTAGACTIYTIEDNALAARDVE